MKMIRVCLKIKRAYFPMEKMERNDEDSFLIRNSKFRTTKTGDSFDLIRMILPFL